MKNLQNILAKIRDDFHNDRKEYALGTPEVSVIIPVYNVEDYIYDCLYSVVNQTFKNIEIIVVNDGTKDDSGKISDEFAKYDSRIKIVNQKNQGLSGARNTGLDTASGNYICFIDSDDWIEANFIESLYNAIKDENADIACATIILKSIECIIQKRMFTQLLKIKSMPVAYLCAAMSGINYTGLTK